MSLISLGDLTAYMGGNPANPPLTPSQIELVRNTIIPGVQEELEKYLHCTVELVQVRESLTPESDGYVYFTYAPVRRILGASWSNAGASPITVEEFVPDPVIVDPNITRPVIDRTAASTTFSAYRYFVGSLGFPGLYSGITPAYMVMDYIAGYDGSNDQSLRTALLRVTARDVERQFDTSAGIRAGSLENAAEADTRGKGWTSDELKAFDRLRRRVIY